MKTKMPSQGTRKYIYLVAAGILTLLAGYGWISDEFVPLWMNLLLTILVPVPVVSAVNTEIPGPYDPPVIESEPSIVREAERPY